MSPVHQEDPSPHGDVIEQARHRAEVVRDHVEQALALAEEQGGPFDFLSVAIAAHCSVGYLRQHREFADRIRRLQATVPADPAADDRDTALRRRLARSEHEVAALRERVAALEGENARLRDRLAAAARSLTAPRLGPGVRRPGTLRRLP